MDKRIMSDNDKRDYLENQKRKYTDSRIIELVREDLEDGLDDRQIDDYTTRNLNYEQMKAVSDMFHAGYTGQAIAVIGAESVSAECMRIAMKLYDSEIDLREIEKGLKGCKTAHDLRKMFAVALGEVAEVLSTPKEEMASDLENTNTLSGYVEKLMDELKLVVDGIHKQDKRYDVLSQKILELHTEKIDESVFKKMEQENRDLKKRIDEKQAEIDQLGSELGKKQDEISKYIQNNAELKNEAEDCRKEIKRMQEEINRLKDDKQNMEETIRDQGQAIVNKNAELERSNTEKLSEAHSDQKMTENEHADMTGNKLPEEVNIPVYYTMAVVKNGRLISKKDIDYMNRKTSVFQSIMSRFASRKKSHRDLMQLVISKELVPEQVNEIRIGLEKGLNEEQLELIINKDLSADRIRSIVSFAALQNSLMAGRSEV